MHSDLFQASNVDDEIDLLQLASTLWARKWVIFSWILAVLIVAASYVFVLAKPRYEASVYIEAPFSHSLARLDRGRKPAGLHNYTPEQVFGYFTRWLGSDEVLQQYLRGVLGYPDGSAISSEKLKVNKWRVRIDPPKPRGRNLYRVTVGGRNGQEANDGLRSYLKLVQMQAARTLAENARQSIELAMNNIRRTVTKQRTIAKEDREDRIQRLTAALAIASAIGQQQPQLTLTHIPAHDSLRPYLDGSELYARGVQSLQAELNVLKARTDDDPFIAGLRDEEAHSRLLREAEEAVTTQAQIPMFRLDGEIIQPEKPVSPKKALVLVLALVLGGLIGAFHVMMLSMIANSPERSTKYSDIRSVDRGIVPQMKDRLSGA